MPGWCPDKCSCVWLLVIDTLTNTPDRWHPRLTECRTDQRCHLPKLLLVRSLIMCISSHSPSGNNATWSGATQVIHFHHDHHSGGCAGLWLVLLDLMYWEVRGDCEWLGWGGIGLPAVTSDPEVKFCPPPPRTTDAYRQILWRTTTREWCLWRHYQFSSSLSQPWWVLLILLCTSTHLSLSLSLSLFLPLFLSLSLSPAGRVMSACRMTTWETTTTVSSPSLTCQYKYSPFHPWWVQCICVGD